MLDISTTDISIAIFLGVIIGLFKDRIVSAWLKLWNCKPFWKWYCRGVEVFTIVGWVWLYDKI